MRKNSKNSVIVEKNKSFKTTLKVATALAQYDALTTQLAKMGVYVDAKIKGDGLKHIVAFNVGHTRVGRKNYV